MHQRSAPAGRHVYRNAIPPRVKPQRGEMWDPLQIVRSVPEDVSDLHRFNLMFWYWQISRFLELYLVGQGTCICVFARLPHLFL